MVITMWTEYLKVTILSCPKCGKGKINNTVRVPWSRGRSCNAAVIYACQITLV